MFCLHLQQVKPNGVLTRCGCIYFGKPKLFSSQIPSCKDTESKLRGTVFVSSANNIYTNLALEDWFYRRWNFSSEHVLLLWRNEPCIVIGRHQNPWVECNTHFLAQKNICLARRNSGGGTVYHDMGNLNCTFFTDRSRYNRKANLELICRALRRDWNVDVSVTAREDITLDGEFKISGTAAKLARDTAYHHCTVLFKADKDILVESLTKQASGMESKATASVSSTVKNLQDVVPDIDYWPLIRSISREFFLAHQSSNAWNVIEPTEETCPGINVVRKHLASWEWIYGHTPRFTLKRHFPLPLSGFSAHSEPIEMPAQVEFYRELSTAADQLIVSLQVYHAKIENILVTPPSFLTNSTMSAVMNGLNGTWFRDEDIKHRLGEIICITTDMQESERKKVLYISDCLIDMISSV